MLNALEKLKGKFVIVDMGAFSMSWETLLPENLSVSAFLDPLMLHSAPENANFILKPGTEPLTL